MEVCDSILANGMEPEGLEVGSEKDGQAILNKSVLNMNLMTLD